MMEYKLGRMWGAFNGFKLAHVGLRFYYVFFENSMDLDWVIQNGPWFINGVYLPIKKWELDFQPENLEVDSAVVWVEFKGYQLPIILQ